MPQLVKGGKWVYGWTVVNSGGEAQIPPKACAEYGFQSGGKVIFLHGSRRSGGCGVARRQKLAGSQIPVVQRGPIYEEALRHPEIEVFSA